MEIVTPSAASFNESDSMSHSMSALFPSPNNMSKSNEDQIRLVLYHRIIQTATCV